MKYKEIATEAQEKLQAALMEIEVLKRQLHDTQNGLFDQLCQRLETEDAKEILRRFGPRSENRDELVLLIRALTTIKGQ